jgi:hypothetical protein
MGIFLAEDAGLGYDVYGDDDLRGGRVIDFLADGRVETHHVFVKDCLHEQSGEDRI